MQAETIREGDESKALKEQLAERKRKKKKKKVVDNDGTQAGSEEVDVDGRFLQENVETTRAGRKGSFLDTACNT